MQRKMFGMGIALISVLSGCYDIRDSIDDYQMSVITEMHASRAYRRCKSVYADVEHRKHFGEGFLAGYADVANGGRGCPPTLPPRKYWSVWYQNPSGQAKARAWFDGFAHGALAAEQESAAHWGEVMTSVSGQACWVPEGAEHQIILEGMAPGPVLPPGVPPAVAPDVPYDMPYGVPPAPAAEPIDMTLDPMAESEYLPTDEPAPDADSWQMPIRRAGGQNPPAGPEL